MQKAQGSKQLKRTSGRWLLVAWVGDEVAYSRRRQKRTFVSLKKSKVQIQLSNILQPKNSVLNTEIYSKWKKLFCIDVNSYVIEFLWGHNCLNVCSFPGTILYLPKWSVEEAEWPALTGCASGLIIALFVRIFLLCPIRRIASLPINWCCHWPEMGISRTSAVGDLSCVNTHFTFAWDHRHICDFVSLRLCMWGAPWWLPILDPWSLWDAVLLLAPPLTTLFLGSDSFKKWLTKLVFSPSEAGYLAFLVLVVHLFGFEETICLLPYFEDSSE